MRQSSFDSAAQIASLLSSLSSMAQQSSGGAARMKLSSSAAAAAAADAYSDEDRISGLPDELLSSMAQQSGGAVRIKLSSSSSSSSGSSSSSAAAAAAAADAYTGEDRISLLPDELLVLILLGLDTTAEALRTSVLAHRWRRVWAQLPVLRFDNAPDLHRIRELIADPEQDAPEELDFLSITTEGADAESAGAWLPAAARRVNGGFVFHNQGVEFEAPLSDDDEDDEAAAAAARGVVQLPCFPKADAIELDLGFLDFALPSAGAFARLRELSIFRVVFRRPCELGDVVSSPRCPSLQRLSVQMSLGIGGVLTIVSESLLEVDLGHLVGFGGLTMVTPALQQLDVCFCLHNYYREEYVNAAAGGGVAAAGGGGGGGGGGGAAQGNGHEDESVVHITAPQLQSLGWDDLYLPRYVHFGNVDRLKQLSSYLYVYLQQGNEMNRNCLRLLQRFPVLESLVLMLVFPRELTNNLQYKMGEITMLPQIMSLELTLLNRSHAFGDSCFHLLRMCAGLQRLTFQFFESTNLEVQYVCPSGCLCQQQTEWKTEKLTMMHLEEVVIIGTNGTDHEIGMFERLIDWAVKLKRLRLKYRSNNESKVNEVHQKLQRFARPETSITLEELPE